MKHLTLFEIFDKPTGKRGNKYYFEVHLKSSTHNILTKIASDNYRSFKQMCEIIIQNFINQDNNEDIELRPNIKENGPKHRTELHFTPDAMEKITEIANKRWRSVKNLAETILKDYIRKI